MSGMAQLGYSMLKILQTDIKDALSATAKEVMQAALS